MPDRPRSTPVFDEPCDLALEGIRLMFCPRGDIPQTKPNWSADPMHWPKVAARDQGVKERIEKLLSPAHWTARDPDAKSQYGWAWRVEGRKDQVIVLLEEDGTLKIVGFNLGREGSEAGDKIERRLLEVFGNKRQKTSFRLSLDLKALRERIAQLEQLRRKTSSARPKV